MNRVPHGLAANPSLPASLVDRLIALADEDLASELAERGDLRHDQVVALTARDEHTARSLAFAGLLTAADVDPVARPLTALALLDTGAGRPEWARLLARHPVVRHREELASCAGLPDDVIEALAVDTALDVVHELAAFTPEPAMAARLARHPHAQVRRGVAVNEATPPAVPAALLTGEGLPAATACLVCDSKPIPYEHDPNCPDPDCTLFGGRRATAPTSPPCTTRCTGSWATPRPHRTWRPDSSTTPPSCCVGLSPSVPGCRPRCTRDWPGIPHRGSARPWPATPRWATRRSARSLRAPTRLCGAPWRTTPRCPWTY